MPSPLKSAEVTERGPSPEGKTAAGPKLPVPVPSRTERLSERVLAEARSRMPSPLKSAEVTEVGLSPALKLAAGPKLPLPVPSRTERLSESALAEARS